MAQQLTVHHYHHRLERKPKKQGFWRSMVALATKEAVGISNLIVDEVVDTTNHAVDTALLSDSPKKKR